MTWQAMQDVRKRAKYSDNTSQRLDGWKVALLVLLKGLGSYTYAVLQGLHWGLARNLLWHQALPKDWILLCLSNLISTLHREYTGISIRDEVC